MQARKFDHDRPAMFAKTRLGLRAVEKDPRNAAMLKKERSEIIGRFAGNGGIHAAGADAGIQDIPQGDSARA